jgi:hypothetical protein
VYFGSAVAALVGALNDSASGWHHEWLMSEYGFLDSPAAVDNLPVDEWKWAYGVAESNGYVHANTPFCNTPWGKLWCDAHQRDPNTYPANPPADYELYWVELRVLGAQMIAAGPNLTPQNVKTGMFQNCAPCIPEAGIQYPSLVGFGPRFPEGPYSTAKDYELVRWDPNSSSPYEMGYKDSGHYKGACNSTNPPSSSMCGSYEPVSNFPDLFPGLPDPHLGWKRWFDWNTPDPR